MYAEDSRNISDPYRNYNKILLFILLLVAVSTIAFSVSTADLSSSGGSVVNNFNITNITGGNITGNMSTGFIQYPFNSSQITNSQIFQQTNGSLGFGIANPAVDFQFLGYFNLTGRDPADNGLSRGTAAPSTFNVQGATGGNTTIATTGTGGQGTNLTINSGKGGLATVATTSNTGGTGGLINIIAGDGGSPTVNATNDVGGTGATFNFFSGNGGTPTSGVTQGGGAGGNFNMFAGSGGNGYNISGSGGAGGAFALSGGTGGNLLSGTFNTGGTGGSFALTGGVGGTSTNTAGGGGGITGVRGGAGGNGNSGGNSGDTRVGPSNTGIAPGGNGNISNGGIGSIVLITSTNGGTSSSATGGAGGDVRMVLGNGGTGNVSGGVGGSFFIKPGVGGNTSANGKISALCTSAGACLGLMGVLTINPTFVLQVNGNASFDNITYVQDGKGMYVGTSSTTVQNITMNGNDLYVAGDTEIGASMLINSNLGIGTVSPSQRLQVIGSTRTTQLRLDNASNSGLDTCVLVAGACVISNTRINVSTAVFCFDQLSTANSAAIAVSNRNAGFNYTISSLNVLDTSPIACMLVEPN